MVKCSAARVTMGDVAEKAGVSKMTVSLALRGNSRLAKATEARVRQIAQEMGYVPDPMLSALNMHKYKLNKNSLTETLAVVFPERAKLQDGDSVQHAGTLDTFRRIAADTGFGTEEFCLQEYSGSRLVSVLKARGIRGLILFAYGQNASQLADLPMVFSGFTGIQMGFASDFPAMPCVDLDVFASVATAFNKLQERGCKRPALLLHDATPNAVRQRYFAAFHAYCAQLSLDDPNPVRCFTAAELKKGQLAAFVSNSKIDVILSPDLEIYQALHTAARAIKRVPGFICLNLNSSGQGVTGVHLDQETVASTVMEMMETDLRHNRRGPQQIRRNVFLAGHWVDGGTF